VTPSPEPRSAPAGETDRSADFDSFLDDFDPSEGDDTTRVEDASAWLDGSPGGQELSPEVTRARPNAGDDSASSFEFATPEFAASASRGSGNARRGESSRDAALDDDGAADVYAAKDVDDVRARLTFKNADPQLGRPVAAGSDSDVSTDVDADADVLSTLDVLTSPGAAAAGRKKVGGEKNAPPETPAPLRGLGVGPDEWAREASQALAFSPTVRDFDDGVEAARDAATKAYAFNTRVHEEESARVEADGADAVVVAAEPRDSRAAAAAPAFSPLPLAATLLSDAEAEIREMRDAVAKMALEESDAKQEEEEEEVKEEKVEKDEEEKKEEKDEEEEATFSARADRTSEDPPETNPSEEDARSEEEEERHTSPEAPNASEGFADDRREDAALPESADAAAVKIPRDADPAPPPAFFFEKEAKTPSSPSRLEDEDRDADEAEEGEDERLSSVSSVRADSDEAAQTQKSAVEDDASREEEAEEDVSERFHSRAEPFLSSAEKIPAATAAETAVVPSALGDTDARAEAEASLEADAIAALEREAEEAEAAARAMLAAAARKRDAVLAAAAAAAAAPPGTTGPPPPEPRDVSSTAEASFSSPSDVSQGDASVDAEDVSSAAETKERELLDGADRDGGSSGDLLVSPRPTTKQALDRVKQARARRRETLLRGVARERDVIAAELERRADKEEKETVLEMASRPSPSPFGSATRASSLGSARRVAARDAVARTRAAALEAANAKRVARIEREREAAAKALSFTAAKDLSPTPPSRDKRLAPLGRSSLEPPGYARAIASPATSGSRKKAAATERDGAAMKAPSPSPSSSSSSRPASARRPWGFHAPAEAAEAAARRAATPEKFARRIESARRRAEARAASPPATLSPEGKTRGTRVAFSGTRSPLSRRDVANVGASHTPNGLQKGTPLSETPSTSAMKNVSPLFLNRLTDARASLTKLSRASGAAEAILDDGAAVLSALASRGFDLDELESVWTSSPSSLGSFVGRTNERPPSDDTEVSSKTPATARGVAFETSLAKRTEPRARPTGDSSETFSASPSLTDASTPMSEFERRFMASYEERATSASPSPRSPSSSARGRAATEAAKRAAARALDALEAEDDDDFERFFAKYRTESEAAAEKGRAFSRRFQKDESAFFGSPETPASAAVRRAYAAAALDASPGKAVAAARSAAAAARRDPGASVVAKPTSRLRVRS